MAIEELQPTILTGWKEIANYLRKGVRTVQRYERELGLPVGRSSGKAMGSVIASKADLEDWVSGRLAKAEPIWDFTPVARRANKLKADFLLIDSQMALTFSGIALTTSNSATQVHTTQEARKAYNTIIRLRQDIDLSDQEKNKLDVNMARLKGELQRLGQNF